MLPYQTEGQDESTIKGRLAYRIAEESATVQAHASTWRTSTTLDKPPSLEVEDTTLLRVAETVFPWPHILSEPTREKDDARFVKSFPLELPMGTGDLRQPRLRNDFSTVDWVQHKLRYLLGHFLSARRGHRVIWALFNTALREISQEKVSLVHRRNNRDNLTKQ